MMNRRFLSTLSLRRATTQTQKHLISQTISIHALLAESDNNINNSVTTADNISIHALLAESDNQNCDNRGAKNYFYPRSPCGERPVTARIIDPTFDFYPRSPCGERLIHPLLCNAKPNFYPRSPCGERLA